MTWVQSHQAPRWVFRGQSQHWPLRPRIGRSFRYHLDTEIMLLSEFRRLSRPLIDLRGTSNDWDILAIAQHHGVPTRLLDWSTNPLAALFFACEPSKRGRLAGEVIAVEPRQHGYFDPSNPDEIDPFKITTNGFVYPSVVAARINAQRGLFSIHANPKKSWRLRNQTDRFVVPGNLKDELRRLLFSVGIDEALLMADVDGLAATLSWRYDAGISFR